MQRNCETVGETITGERPIVWWARLQPGGQALCWKHREGHLWSHALPIPGKGAGKVLTTRLPGAGPGPLSGSRHCRWLRLSGHVGKKSGAGAKFLLLDKRFALSERRTRCTPGRIFAFQQLMNSGENGGVAPAGRPVDAGPEEFSLRAYPTPGYPEPAQEARGSD